MRHRNFLEYRRFLHLKLAAAASVAAAVAYALCEPVQGHYGGTPVGYALGTVAAALTLWLAWFGVRKRRYRSDGGLLLGWLSAHVYWGLALAVIATLHTGFELGANVHTLAYGLLLGVVASGIYGVVVYLQLPRLMTTNLGEDTLETLFLKLADLDQESRRLALQLSDEANALVLAASQGTRIGGGVWRQLRGRERNCPTDRAVQRLEALGATLRDEPARVHRELYHLMLRRQALVRRARKDIRLKARLDVWLYLHVPLAVAMLAALLAHVVSVFFYW